MKYLLAAVFISELIFGVLITPITAAISPEWEDALGWCTPEWNNFVIDRYICRADPEHTQENGLGVWLERTDVEMVLDPTGCAKYEGNKLVWCDHGVVRPPMENKWKEIALLRAGVTEERVKEIMDREDLNRLLQQRAWLRKRRYRFV